MDLDFLTDIERQRLGDEKIAGMRTLYGTPVAGAELNTTQTMSAGAVHLGSTFVLLASPLFYLSMPTLHALLLRLVHRPKEGELSLVELRAVNRKVQLRLGAGHAFVRFHVLQSLWWNLLFVITAPLTCGLAAIPFQIFNYLAYRRAREGKWYRLPLVGERAEKRIRAGAHKVASVVDA